jgi:hypothetical protein
MKKFPSHVTRDSGGGPVSPSRVTRESSWVTALDMRGRQWILAANFEFIVLGWSVSKPLGSLGPCVLVFIDFQVFLCALVQIFFGPCVWPSIDFWAFLYALVRI